LIFNTLLFWHAIGYMLIISAKVERNLTHIAAIGGLIVKERA
jgi:hypothetical protein